MGTVDRSASFEDAQRAGSPHPSAAFEDRDRSQGSLHQAANRLQLALARAQSGRETAWAELVGEYLKALIEALLRHRDGALGPDGLYAEILADAPHLLPRVQELEEQLEVLVRDARALDSAVGRVCGENVSEMVAIRPDAEHLCGSLRDFMARENDLMFDRFADLPALD